MLLKAGQFVCVELTAAEAKGGLAYFGQVAGFDDVGLLLTAIDIQAQVATGWELAITWRTIRYIMVAPAAVKDIASFALAVAQSRAAQSSRVN